MANFHLQFNHVIHLKEKLPLESRKSSEKSVLWIKLENFIKLCPQQYELVFFWLKISFHSKLYSCRYSSSVPPKETVQNELKWLKRMLEQLNNQLVFCHNDLLLANILYDKDENSIQFIDFEYAGANYQAYDIANHFCEFSGMII